MSQPIQPFAVERKAFYSKDGRSFPYSYMHCSGRDRKVRPECILVEKVINECFIAECPIIIRFPNIGPVSNIEDCQVLETTVIDVEVPEEDVIELTFRFKVRVAFDGRELIRTFDFVKRVLLEGADPDAFEQGVLFVVPFSFAQCLNCRIVNDDDIECELGLFVLLKLTAFVQLEIQAVFCPMPPECTQISPIGCPEFLERAARGDFLPPRPEQFFPSSTRSAQVEAAQEVEITPAKKK